MNRQELLPWTALALGCCGSVGCGAAPERVSPDAPSVTQEPAPPPQAARPFEERRAQLLILEVPGFEAARLLVPPGDTQLPLVVASHGAGGTAEDECRYWEQALPSPAFVACPNGTPFERDAPAAFYRTHLELEREVLAVVAQTRAKLGARLSSEGGLYAGFSQGAIMGAAMIAPHGNAFPYLALVEGGYEYWSVAQARRFHEEGGRRVLFSCGTKTCAERSRAPARWLEQAGVEVRIEFAPAGHTPGGAVFAQTRAALPWLLARGAAAPRWHRACF